MLEMVRSERSGLYVSGTTWTNGGGDADSLGTHVYEDFRADKGHARLRLCTERVDICR